MNRPNSFFIILIPLIFTGMATFFRFADGGKRRIHIEDDLDDKSILSSDEFDPAPSDLSNMDMSQIQELMRKQHWAGFWVRKLQFGVRGTPEMVAAIAMTWTKVLIIEAIKVKFMGVDTSTIKFTEKGQNMVELKEFILNEPEAYEIKIRDQVFRKPGGPTLEEVIEKLQSKKETTLHPQSSTFFPLICFSNLTTLLI
ncbi:hypothetical protein MANES_01G255500v8 [Manihot esculenta]|uniref:Uncharacterized protein n=1 Tax=Manihot esculenta TaxID=3983 RepID=A0ACB7IH49_MANES|nr:hypothetical protein MANES_01G255500v8 [Manihot esculenta]